MFSYAVDAFKIQIQSFVNAAFKKYTSSWDTFYGPAEFAKAIYGTK